MSYDEANEARNRINDVRRSLHSIYREDHEEEVSEYSLRSIDAALRQAVALVPEDDVVKEIREIFSPEAVEAGSPIRIAEVLTVIDQLSGILNRLVSNMAMNQPGAVRRRGSR